MFSGKKILGIWNLLEPMPFGKYAFSKIIGWKVPYTGSICARVESLAPGVSRVRLKDHHSIRNHLNSIHAIALLNLGELASALAMFSCMPEDIRGIVTSISVDYYKKARGDLVAESVCQLPPIENDMTKQIFSMIKNTDEEVVAKVNVVWKLGKKP